MVQGGVGQDDQSFTDMDNDAYTAALQECQNLSSQQNGVQTSLWDENG